MRADLAKIFERHYRTVLRSRMPALVHHFPPQGCEHLFIRPSRVPVLADEQSKAGWTCKWPTTQLL